MSFDPVTPEQALVETYRAKKILYVSARDGMSLQMDGPSIVVKIPQKATMRFPLARLEGMAVEGAPEIPFEIIRSCAVQGIPVALLSKGGTLFGVVLPWRNRPRCRPHPLELLNRQCTMYWLRKARAAMLEELALAGLSGSQPGPRQALDALLAHWSKGSLEVARAVYQRLRAFLASLVNRELARVGVRGDQRVCANYTAQRLITDVESWRLCRLVASASKGDLEEAAGIWEQVWEDFQHRCRQLASYWAGANP